MTLSFAPDDQDTITSAVTTKTHRRRTSSSVSHGGGHLPAHYTSSSLSNTKPSFFKKGSGNNMEAPTVYQRRKSLIIRVLAVIVLLLVFVWLLAPDAEEWNFRRPISPSISNENSDDYFADEVVSENELTPLPSQVDSTDYSKYESPPFNPKDSKPKNNASCHNPKNKSLEEYALMIDAGSTGSRIHVYRFSNCNETPELISEVFEQTKPGLSSYGDDPNAAAASLDVLMKVGLEKVPKDLQRCTPIAVKATAGLRLLGPEKSQLILDAVRSRLETKFPFPLAPKDPVVVMDGSDEGVYAWITVNYLLDNLKDGLSEADDKGDSPDRSLTAAIFDLGGASTQIVFEPNFGFSHDKGRKEKFEEGDHRYQLKFGGLTHDLYQHSYLGYGLMEARKKIKNQVAMHAFSIISEGDDNDDDRDDESPSHSISHPCFPAYYSELFSLNDTYTVKLFGESGSHSHAQCVSLAEKILNKDSKCPLLPCSFAGIYQPSLARTFAHQQIYTFSYFYDRTAPLGMPSEFTLLDLYELTKKVCSAHPKKYFKHLDPSVIEDLEVEPLWCMDLSFIYSLLRFGYDIPEDRMIRVAKKVRDAETGWCLGAAMTMLDDSDLCKLD